MLTASQTSELLVMVDKLSDELDQVLRLIYAGTRKTAPAFIVHRDDAISAMARRCMAGDIDDDEIAALSALSEELRKRRKACAELLSDALRDVSPVAEVSEVDRRIVGNAVASAEFAVRRFDSLLA